MYHLPPKRLVWFAAGGAKFQQIPARPSNFDTDEWNEQGYVSADKHTSRSASSTLCACGLCRRSATHEAETNDNLQPEQKQCYRDVMSSQQPQQEL
jgi:hypothetical protein